MSENSAKFAADVMDKGGVLKVMGEQLDRLLGGQNQAERAANAAALARIFKSIFVTAGDVAVALRGAIKWVNELLQPIGGLKTVLGYLLAAFYAFRALSFVRALLLIAGPAFGVVATMAVKLAAGLGILIPIIYSLGVALMTTPVGWIIMAIAAIVAAAWWMYENWDKVTKWFHEAWDWLFGDPALAEGWAEIKRMASDAADKVVSAWSAVRTFFEELWGFITAGWDRSIGAIPRGIDKVRELLPSFGSNPPPAPAIGAGVVGGGVLGAAARTQVEGRLQVEIDVRGADGARIRRSGSSGPINFDPTLGLAGGF